MPENLFSKLHFRSTDLNLKMHSQIWYLRIAIIVDGEAGQ